LRRTGEGALTKYEAGRMKKELEQNGLYVGRQAAGVATAMWQILVLHAS
jgi:hypothetical protein